MGLYLAQLCMQREDLCIALCDQYLQLMHLCVCACACVCMCVFGCMCVCACVCE
jgi:hypothetical protein